MRRRRQFTRYAAIGMLFASVVAAVVDWALRHKEDDFYRNMTQ